MATTDFLNTDSNGYTWECVLHAVNADGSLETDGDSRDHWRVNAGDSVTVHAPNPNWNVTQTTTVSVNTRIDSADPGDIANELLNKLGTDYYPAPESLSTPTPSAS